MVEILRLAADIDEPVDRRGTSDDFAARIKDRAPVRAGIGFGVEAPGEPRMVEEPHKACRDVDIRAPVAPAGLDQYDFCAGVFSQPVGEHAARRAGADNHIISLHRRLPVTTCYCAASAVIRLPSSSTASPVLRASSITLGCQSTFPGSGPPTIAINVDWGSSLALRKPR